VKKQLLLTSYLIVLTSLHKILGDCVCQW
jgi:hypothetical protein